MSAKILTAIRLCGEIDNDGEGYGSEDDREDYNEFNEENARGVDDLSEEEPLEKTNWSARDENEDPEGFADLSEEEKGIEGTDTLYQF